jgi:hypothetical protein
LVWITAPIFPQINLFRLLKEKLLKRHPDQTDAAAAQVIICYIFSHYCDRVIYIYDIFQNAKLRMKDFVT